MICIIYDILLPSCTLAVVFKQLRYYSKQIRWSDDYSIRFKTQEMYDVQKQLDNI